MMDVLQKMISTQAILFLYMIAGFICSKTRMITKETRGLMNVLLINVTLPCMICASFFAKRTLSELVSAGMMMLISAGICLFSFGLAKLLWNKRSPEEKGVLTFCSSFSNAGNAGMPVVSMVFGESGVVFASFFLIPIRITMWTLGLSCFVPLKRGGRVKKLLTNPCLVAVFIGVVLMLLPWQLPSFAQDAVRNIGDMTGVISMMLVGATLSEIRLRELLDQTALLVSLLRLVVLPVILLVILRLLGVESLLVCVAVTLIAMPSATLTAVFADTYGADTHLATKCIFLSTLLSLFTVPLVTMLL